MFRPVWLLFFLTLGTAANAQFGVGQVPFLPPLVDRGEQGLNFTLPRTFTMTGVAQGGIRLIQPQLPPLAHGVAPGLEYTLPSMLSMSGMERDGIRLDSPQLPPLIGNVGQSLEYTLPRTLSMAGMGRGGIRLKPPQLPSLIGNVGQSLEYTLPRTLSMAGMGQDGVRLKSPQVSPLVGGVGNSPAYAIPQILTMSGNAGAAVAVDAPAGSQTIAIGRPIQFVGAASFTTINLIQPLIFTGVSGQAREIDVASLLTFTGISSAAKQVDIQNPLQFTGKAASKSVEVPSLMFTGKNTKAKKGAAKQVNIARALTFVGRDSGVPQTITVSPALTFHGRDLSQTITLGQALQFTGRAIAPQNIPVNALTFTGRSLEPKQINLQSSLTFTGVGVNEFASPVVADVGGSPKASDKQPSLKLKQPKITLLRIVPISAQNASTNPFSFSDVREDVEEAINQEVISPVESPAASTYTALSLVDLNGYIGGASVTNLPVVFNVNPSGYSTNTLQLGDVADQNTLSTTLTLLPATDGTTGYFSATGLWNVVSSTHGLTVTDTNTPSFYVQSTSGGDIYKLTIGFDTCSGSYCVDMKSLSGYNCGSAIGNCP